MVAITFCEFYRDLFSIVAKRKTTFGTERTEDEIEFATDKANT